MQKAIYAASKLSRMWSKAGDRKKDTRKDGFETDGCESASLRVGEHELRQG
jgi:hypothetical protein